MSPELKGSGIREFIQNQEGLVELGQHHVKTLKAENQRLKDAHDGLALEIEGLKTKVLELGRVRRVVMLYRIQLTLLALQIINSLRLV